MPTTNNSNDAHTHMHVYSHTPKSLKKKQHRKNTHVVEVGGGGGEDDDAWLGRDNDTRCRWAG